MNTKKMLYAWLAGAAGMLILGILWHTVIMGDFYDTHLAAVARDVPKMPFVIFGYLVLALLMAYMFPLGYKGGSAITEGLRFGILIGLLWVLPLQLVFHGLLNIGLTGSLVDAGWHVVEQGVGGIIIAMVYGEGAVSESS